MGKDSYERAMNEERYFSDPKGLVCGTENNVPRKNVLMAGSREALTLRSGSGVAYRKM